MSVAAVLRRAAQAYRDGDIRWGKGWFRDRETGCRCVGGALSFAVGSDEDDPTCATLESDQAMWVLAHYLVDELGAPRMTDGGDDDAVTDVVETVGAWNDADDRVVEDVIAALEAAAERAA